jgi:hypothetical protein
LRSTNKKETDLQARLTVFGEEQANQGMKENNRVGRELQCEILLA